MKLLIVDDEKLTREGLVASINWKSLGISQVFQADDGLNGLALAKKRTARNYSLRCPDAPYGWHPNGRTD